MTKKCPRDNQPIPVDVDFDDHASQEAVDAFETEHVHAVYMEIAEHFSHTRYNPWPSVLKHVKELDPGSIVVDAGCGNGKYLGFLGNHWFVGLDVCARFFQAPMFVAKGKCVDGVIANLKAMPIRKETADLVLCIATLHHLSSRASRLKTLLKLLDVCISGGKVVVYVWAFEQEAGSIGAREFSRQNVLVPWYLQRRFKGWGGGGTSGGNSCGALDSPGVQDSPSSTTTCEEIYMRYYHVFTRDEIQSLADSVQDVCSSYTIDYEANNWILILHKR